MGCGTQGWCGRMDGGPCACVLPCAPGSTHGYSRACLSMCDWLAPVRRACMHACLPVWACTTVCSPSCLHACMHAPQVKARSKSLFSIMKKLLRLTSSPATPSSGRSIGSGSGTSSSSASSSSLSLSVRGRDAVYDLLGLRACVQPRTDLPQQQVGLQGGMQAAGGARHMCRD